MSRCIGGAQWIHDSLPDVAAVQDCVPHVRCVSSCTGGLILGLRALGIGPGDEVILPTMTFVASANAVELVGARPIFVDSVDETGVMDLDAAERAIGPATKALMVVHLAGRPLDMDR